eukprot:g6203.t1
MTTKWQELTGAKKAKRSSSRSKRKRSANARKFIAYDGSKAGLRVALDSRLEQLEVTNFDDLREKGEEEDEDDYQEDNEGKSLPRQKKLKHRVKQRKGKKFGRVSNGKEALLKLKPLTELLLQENAEKLSLSHGNLSAPAYHTAMCHNPAQPARSICVASGFGAKYREPLSGLPYCSIKTLSTIQEAAPRWTKGGSNATYVETIALLKEKDDEIFDYN